MTHIRLFLIGSRPPLSIIVKTNTPHSIDVLLAISYELLKCVVLHTFKSFLFFSVGDSSFYPIYT